MTRKLKQLDLYLRYQAKVFRYFWYRSDGNRPLCEDLCAETFCRMIKDFDRYDAERPALPWLYGIAHNIWCNHLRVQGRELSFEDIPEPTDSPLLEIESVIDAKNILSRIGEMKDANRELMLLRFCEGMSCKEIARVVDKSEGAIRTKLHRLVKELRQEYQENYEG
jgi:RNA polymerase sigma-70 factor (ECF subfamily)